MSVVMRMPSAAPAMTCGTVCASPSTRLCMTSTVMNPASTAAPALSVMNAMAVAHVASTALCPEGQQPLIFRPGQLHARKRPTAGAVTFPAALRVIQLVVEQDALALDPIPTG